MLDENRIEGAGKSMGGKVQDAVGGLTGDTGLQARGKANQAAGSAQNALGSVMDAASEWSGSVAEITKDKPLTALLVAASVGYMLHMLTHRSRR